MFNVNPGIMASVAGGSSVSYKLIDIITRLGLTSSLQVCCDAGDADSYGDQTGVTQRWSDVSGNSLHHKRGNTTGAEASDPTFNGTVGDLSASTYFSYDGADFFTADATHSYADNIHKDNGIITVIMVIQALSGAKSRDSALWSTRVSDAVNEAGVGVRISATKVLEFVRSYSTFLSVAGNSGLTLTGGIPEFIGVSYDESQVGTAAYRFRKNEASATVVGTNASTDTGACGTVHIGVNTNETSALVESGERIYCFAVFNTALTDAEMASIYTQLKLRIPSIP